MISPKISSSGPGSGSSKPCVTSAKPWPAHLKPEVPDEAPVTFHRGPEQGSGSASTSLGRRISNASVTPLFSSSTGGKPRQIIGAYLLWPLRNLFFFLHLVTCALSQLVKSWFMIHGWKERLNQSILAVARLKVGCEHGPGCRSWEGSSSPPGGSPTAPKPPAPLLEATPCWHRDFSACALVLGELFFPHREGCMEIT